MEIVGHIDKYVLAGIRAVVHQPHMPVLIVKVAVPGPASVAGKIRIAAGKGVSACQRFLPVQDPVFLSEGDQTPYKIGQILGCLFPAPVYPGKLAVVAVGIVVSLLRISDLVAGQQHRGPLGQQHHGKGVFHLPLAQLQDASLPGRALRPAVPAVVAGGAVSSLLPVGFVMLFVIGYQIHHGKTVMAGNIVHHAGVFRIISHPGHKISQLVFVSFQELSGGGQKTVVALRQAAHGMFPLSLVNGVRREIAGDQLCPHQNRIACQSVGSLLIHKQGKTVHMVFLHPPGQTLVYHSGIDRIRKGKFHDYLYAVFMEGAHHGLKFPHRVFGGAVGILGRKVMAFCIAPEIQLFSRRLQGGRKGRCPRRTLLRCGRTHNLVKFVGRHQNYLVDPQFFQIGDLLLQSQKGALVTDSGVFLLRKASHMEVIGDHILIGDRQGNLILPPVKVFRCKASPHLVFAPGAGIAEHIPAPHHVGGRIHRHPVSYPEIIFILPGRNPLHLHGADNPCIVLSGKGNLLGDLFFPPGI